jgi:Holliday junction resolvase
VAKINSRTKGAVGERELAKLLIEHGFEAKRGQQHAGSPDSPDVKHNIPGIHIEVKRVEKLNIYNAMEQSIRDAGSKLTPTVFHRKNRKPWLVTMLAKDWLKEKKK